MIKTNIHNHKKQTMKLSKIFEKYRRQKDGSYQLQVIDLWAEAATMEEASELSVSDFSADLYINGEFIGDISFALDDAGVLEVMVQAGYWPWVFQESLAAAKEAKGDELFTAKKDNQ